MNMSIKVCVPHHMSSQKHLLISTLEASPPELSCAQEQGLLVAAPPVPASPEPWGGLPASLPLPLLPPLNMNSLGPEATGPLLALALSWQAQRETGRSREDPPTPPPSLWPGMLQDVVATPLPAPSPRSPQGLGFG